MTTEYSQRAGGAESFVVYIVLYCVLSDQDAAISSGGVPPPRQEPSFGVPWGGGFDATHQRRTSLSLALTPNLTRPWTGCIRQHPVSARCMLGSAGSADCSRLVQSEWWTAAFCSVYNLHRHTGQHGHTHNMHHFQEVLIAFQYECWDGGWGSWPQTRGLNLVWNILQNKIWTYQKMLSIALS